MTQVKRVPGTMESIIYLDDETAYDHRYEDMLEIFQWLLKNKEPASLVDAAKDGFRKFFVGSFESLLSEMGLFFKDSTNKGIYLRIDNSSEPFVDVNFKGEKIIPGRDHVLDGLTPEISFFIKSDQPKQIKTTCKFNLEGDYILSLLIDLVPLCYFTDEKQVIIEPVESSSYKFAPLDEFHSLCHKLKSLAEFLGREQLVKIETLRRTIKDAGEKLSEYGVDLNKALNEGIYARTLLETLGVKF